MKYVYWLLIGLFIGFGAVESSAQTVYTFEGNVDFLDSSARMEVDLEDKGKLVLSAQKQDEQSYLLNIVVNNLQTSRFDWSSQIEGVIKFSPTEEQADRLISGKIRSQYSLINYQPPSRELSSEFFVDADKRIHFSSLAYASLEASGYSDTFYPFAFDFDVELDDVDMDDFLSFWMTEKTFEAKGPVSGTVEVKGDQNQVFLNGDLESSEGYVSRFDFNRIVLKVTGVYPYLQVFDSNFSSKEGASFSLAGPFNLAQKDNFKAQIKALTFSPLLSGSDLKREWTVKKIENEDKSSKFSYFIEKAIEDSTRGSSQTDMLGIEQKLEF